jgi:hypothetical protein
LAIKKLNTSIPPVSLNSMWGTNTTGTGILTGTTTTTGGYISTPGSYLTTAGTTINWGNGISMNSDIIEYIDIFYQFMGIDMDYKRFSEMTKEEKKGFIRDLKLKKLIDDK